jgi:predicted amidophosphoribosyltransferase
MQSMTSDAMRIAASLLDGLSAIRWSTINRDLHTSLKGQFDNGICRNCLTRLVELDNWKGVIVCTKCNLHTVDICEDCGQPALDDHYVEDVPDWSRVCPQYQVDDNYRGLYYSSPDSYVN